MSDLKIKTLKFISCASCGREKVVPAHLDGAPEGLVLFELYKEKWTFYGDLWYCPKCRPEKLKMDPEKHPHYTDYQDQWDNRPPEECRSHYFENETYDPYATWIKRDMCECCEYMVFGYEDDMSRWRMCIVDDPDSKYCHNLYSGHFSGAAISGRLCPYFRCRHIRGRNPKRDKENGTFHVPYNEEYDGD